MKLWKFKNMAMIGAMSVAGVGLIGVGAHATFTTSTASAQTITAGTLNITLSSSDAASGNGSPSLTLAAVGPTASSFTTGDQLVTITNSGNVTAAELTATPGDTFDGSGGALSANSRLAAEVYLCETSSGEVIYNGLLSAATLQDINGSLAPAATDNYTFNIYAGDVTTGCGSDTTVGSPAVSGTSSAPSLANDAEGGVINPSLTVAYSG
jgi:hypothetical protein